MECLRVGLIGTGSISQYHCEAMEKVSNIRPVALTNLDLDRAKQFAERFNIEKVYGTSDELLDDTDVDAVIIATPTFTHHEIIINALNHGKHAFCEKPPALNAAQVLECKQTAEAAGKVLMFGLVCRFSGRIAKFKEMIDDGCIGNVYYSEAVRTKAVSRIGGWFLNRAKSGGGELFDGCIHEIDQVLYLLGYPKPKYVSAVWTHENTDLADKVADINFDWVSSMSTKDVSTVETLASAMIHFEDGTALHIKSGRAMFIDNPEQGFTMLGTKGGLKYDNSGCRLTTLDGTNHLVTAGVDIPDIGGAFENEFAHFADCCLNGKACICDNEEVVMLMQILDAIYRSAESQEPVFLK